GHDCDRGGSFRPGPGSLRAAAASSNPTVWGGPGGDLGTSLELRRCVCEGARGCSGTEPAALETGQVSRAYQALTYGAHPRATTCFFVPTISATRLPSSSRFSASISSRCQ